MNKSKFETYFDLQSELVNMKLGLHRIDEALEDNIQHISNRPLFIHVAGTNGKGSTSQFIASILEDNGLSTMLFTSPHIHDVKERIKYRLNNITANEFDRLFDSSKETIIKYSLSFFESLFFMFMLYAKELKPDCIVLETGLGGTYDATNTSFIKDKIPVITSISQDHINILGKNIYKILYDKLGIIKDNKKIFVGKNIPLINDEIKSYCADASIIFIENHIDKSEQYYSSPFMYNYTLAHKVCEYILKHSLEVKRYPLPLCRQEIIGNIMLDGAHNTSGMSSLIKSLEVDPSVIIISTTVERDINKLIKIALKKCLDVITVTIPNNPRSKSRDELIKLPYAFFDDPKDALEYAKNKYKGLILVAGSLYLCAYIRDVLVNK